MHQNAPDLEDTTIQSFRHGEVGSERSYDSSGYVPSSSHDFEFSTHFSAHILKCLWCIYELSVALDTIGSHGRDDCRSGVSRHAWFKYRDAIKEWAITQAKLEELSLEDWEKTPEHGAEYEYYLRHADAENAEVSKESDRTYIVDKIESSPGGWEDLN